MSCYDQEIAGQGGGVKEQTGGGHGPDTQHTGTTLHDGDQALKGYALNKMCFSFNTPPTARHSSRTKTPIARNII